MKVYCQGKYLDLTGSQKLPIGCHVALSGSRNDQSALLDADCGLAPLSFISDPDLTEQDESFMRCENTRDSVRIHEIM